MVEWKLQYSLFQAILTRVDQNKRVGSFLGVAHNQPVLVAAVISHLGGGLAQWTVAQAEEHRVDEWICFLASV